MDWEPELACGFLPCLPPSPQGDIQELLISTDPQAAFQACERYLPGCDHLDPTASGVSGRLVLGHRLSHPWLQVSGTSEF